MIEENAIPIILEKSSGESRKPPIIEIGAYFSAKLTQLNQEEEERKAKEKKKNRGKKQN